MKRLVLAALILSGCAGMPYQQRARTDIRSKHEAMVGKTEDELVDTFGAPTDVKEVGSYRVFYYITDHGVSSSGFAHQGFVSGRARSHAQVSRFYFKAGKIDRWDYDSH